MRRRVFLFVFLVGLLPLSSASSEDMSSGVAKGVGRSVTKHIDTIFEGKVPEYWWQPLVYDVKYEDQGQVMPLQSDSVIDSYMTYLGGLSGVRVSRQSRETGRANFHVVIAGDASQALREVCLETINMKKEETSPCQELIERGQGQGEIHYLRYYDSNNIFHAVVIVGVMGLSKEEYIAHLAESLFRAFLLNESVSNYLSPSHFDDGYVYLLDGEIVYEVDDCLIKSLYKYMNANSSSRRKYNSFRKYMVQEVVGLCGSIY